LAQGPQAQGRRRPAGVPPHRPRASVARHSPGSSVAMASIARGTFSRLGKSTLKEGTERASTWVGESTCADWIKYSEGVVGVTHDNGVVINQVIAAAVFDLMFFWNYFVGWTLTYFFQREFIWNNNVTRVLKGYNICIGVDSWPAQPIAACWFSLVMVVYGYCVWMMVMRLNFDDPAGTWLRRTRLILIYFSTVGWAAFGLTYAVPPDNQIATVIHVMGFVVGLYGYASFKLAAALGLQAHCDVPESMWPELEKQPWVIRKLPWKVRIMLRFKSLGTACCGITNPALLYYWTRVFAALFMVVMGTGLFALLLMEWKDGALAGVANIKSWKIPAEYEGGIDVSPEELSAGWLFWGLVVFALVDPFIALFYMRGTAHSLHAGDIEIPYFGQVVHCQQLFAHAETEAQ